MALTGSLGTVLQGVSQQQPRVRLRGQVSEQINMHSDVVVGLTSRPPTTEIAVFGSNPSDLKFDDVEIDGVKYTVGYRSGVLKVWDAAATAFTVTTQDADAVAYIGDNMSFHVYDDTIYCSNQDVVVAEDATIDTSQILSDQGLVQSLGGSFGRDLTLILTYADASTVEIKLNIPDTDPDEVNGDHIMAHLYGSLNGGSESHTTRTGSKKASTTLTLFKNVMLITDSATTFTITVTDGDDGKVLRQHQNTSKKLEDLVKFAPHGTLLKVDGEQTSDDDFYMRFDVENETTVGNGFGVDGTWREWVNANEPVSLDFKTMPHILYKIASTFYFDRNLWLSRRVGDKDSNPHPSFVGKKITDIGGFQSRLSFTGGPNFVASRTNIPADFYRKSVVTESATDPLDFGSTTESEVDLRWQVPFDRDLLLMSEKHQFIISGLTALTPKNAGMVLTTDFEMAGRARPSSTGRTILFPYKIGKHAGVKEFFASDEIATNGADNITETTSKYILGEITYISTSTNFNTSLILTDDANSSKTVWVYKYLWEGLKKKQSSISKWIFPHDVTYVYWDNAQVFVIMRDGTDYILSVLDMDFADHAVGYAVTLDRQTDEVAGSSNEVVLLYDNAMFVQHTGCAQPGSEATELTKTGSGPYTYTFDAITVPVGATVVAGMSYTQSVTPTMPFIRDRDGRVVTNAKLVVTDILVLFDNSGTINSKLTSKYREDETFDNGKIITSDDPDDPLGIGIRDGVFEIPWGELSEWSELTLTSTGVRPMTILEIEWRGQQFKRGRRV